MRPIFSVYLSWVGFGRETSRSRELAPGSVWHQGNGEVLSASRHSCHWGTGDLNAQGRAREEESSLHRFTRWTRQQKGILNRLGLINSSLSARWCFSSLHPMGSGLGPRTTWRSHSLKRHIPANTNHGINRGRSQVCNKSPAHKTDLTWGNNRSTVRVLLFYRSTNQQTTKPAPNSSVHASAEGQTGQPHVLKPSRCRFLSPHWQHPLFRSTTPV